MSFSKGRTSEDIAFVDFLGVREMQALNFEIYLLFLEATYGMHDLKDFVSL